MSTKRNSKVIVFLFFIGILLLMPLSPYAKTIYKWTDPNGQVHFSDEPPENTHQEILAEEIEVQEKEKSFWEQLGLQKSRKIENPSEAVPIGDELSAWFSSPEMKLFEHRSTWMMTAVFALFILSNLFYSLCLYLIARKVEVRCAWLAWIPVANFIPLVSAAGYPAWYSILFLLPSLSSIPQLSTNTLLMIILFTVLLFDILFIFVLWIKICRNFWISGWFGLLILLPPLFLILLAYLAFREEQDLIIKRLRPALAALTLCLVLTAAFHVSFREIFMPWWHDKTLNEMSSFMESADPLMTLQQTLPENK